MITIIPRLSTIQNRNGKTKILEPDPTFPTVPFPNPEEGKSALNLSMATVEKYNTDNAEDIKNGIKGRSIHILANDPDADRLAVAEFSER